MVSLHTPPIVFFLPFLAGDYQTHLTDKLPDYTQSPKMNPVAHVSLELGRTAPKLTLSHPSRLSSEAPSLGTGPLPAHVSTPQGVPVGSGLPQEPVRLWLSHCRLDAPQREGTAAVTPRFSGLSPGRPAPTTPSGHAPTASLPRPVQARTRVRTGQHRPQTPCDSASHRSFHTAFHWVCQTLDKNVKGKTTK